MALCQVHTIGKAIGRPLRWEQFSRDAARQELVDVFGDASFADGALDAWAGFVTRPEQVVKKAYETGLGVSYRRSESFRPFRALCR